MKWWILTAGQAAETTTRIWPFKSKTRIWPPVALGVDVSMSQRLNPNVNKMFSTIFSNIHMNSLDLCILCLQLMLFICLVELFYRSMPYQGYTKSWFFDWWMINIRMLITTSHFVQHVCVLVQHLHTFISLALHTFQKHVMRFLLLRYLSVWLW